MNKSIENELMKTIPNETIPKKKKPSPDVKYPSMLNNVNMSYSAIEENLKPNIRQFLLKWLHPSATLKTMNSIGSKLYIEILETYTEEDDDEDDI